MQWYRVYRVSDGVSTLIGLASTQEEAKAMAEADFDTLSPSQSAQYRLVREE